MAPPEPFPLDLNADIVREPTPDASSVVLWVPVRRSDGFQYWERVRTAPNADVQLEAGVQAVPATVQPVRQRAQGFVGRLLGRLKDEPAGRTLVLPNGAVAEEYGAPAAERTLVWAAADGPKLDDAWLESRWPQSRDRRQLGPNAYLVDAKATPSGPAPTASPDAPVQGAEEILTAARAAGDRHRETVALTDLGILRLHAGDSAGATAVLLQALATARELGDPALEGDALGNLGLAVLHEGQPALGMEYLEQALVIARSRGDAHLEKYVLDHVGLSHASQREPGRALEAFEQALVLAHRVGDRQHEARLLWYLGIQYAELDRPDQAAALGLASVELLRELRDPLADTFADHLRKYQTAGAPPPGTAADPGTFGSVSLVATAWGAYNNPPPPPVPTSEGGPGLLLMALTAARSAAQFVSGGLKTVSPQTRQRRLRTCAACEHHTGVRCRLCGCFTGAKTWLPHEACPVGKWGAE